MHWVTTRCGGEEVCWEACWQGGDVEQHQRRLTAAGRLERGCARRRKGCFVPHCLVPCFQVVRRCWLPGTRTAWQLGMCNRGLVMLATLPTNQWHIPCYCIHTLLLYLRPAAAAIAVAADADADADAASLSSHRTCLRMETTTPCCGSSSECPWGRSCQMTRCAWVACAELAGPRELPWTN